MSDMGIDMSKLIEGCKAAHDKGIEAATVGVSKFAQHVIGDSQQLTPVDEGHLKGSGIALPAEVNGTMIEAEMGHNTNYAAAVHEVLTAKHKEGQAKYLETAMRNNQPKMIPFVASFVEQSL